jgi:hypothetical protein
MRRRGFLGGCAAVLVAGCPSDGGSGTTPLSAVDCPSLEGNRRVICARDPGDASVFLDVSPRVAAAPESIAFVLHNDSDRALTVNPYSWQLREQGRSEWERLDNLTSGNGTLTLPAGDTHRFDGREIIDSSRQSGLDTGTYAASIRVPDPSGDGWLTCVGVFRLS